MAVIHIKSDGTDWAWLRPEPGGLINLLRKLLVDGGAGYAGLGYTLEYSDVASHIAVFREPTALGGAYLWLNDAGDTFSEIRCYGGMTDPSDPNTGTDQFPTSAATGSSRWAKSTKLHSNPKNWDFVADPKYGFYLRVSTSGNAEATAERQHHDGLAQVYYFGRFVSVVPAENYPHCVLLGATFDREQPRLFSIITNHTNRGGGIDFFFIERDVSQVGQSTRGFLVVPFDFNAQDGCGYERFPNPLTGDIDFFRTALYEISESWGNLQRGWLPGLYVPRQNTYGEFRHGETLTVGDHSPVFTAMKCSGYRRDARVFLQTAGDW